MHPIIHGSKCVCITDIIWFTNFQYINDGSVNCDLGWKQRRLASSHPRQDPGVAIAEDCTETSPPGCLFVTIVVRNSMVHHPKKTWSCESCTEMETKGFISDHKFLYWQKYITIYLHAQAPSIHGKPWKAADLEPLAQFLRDQRDRGNFQPSFPLGLDRIG